MVPPSLGLIYHAQVPPTGSTQYSPFLAPSGLQRRTPQCTPKSSRLGTKRSPPYQGRARRHTLAPAVLGLLEGEENRQCVVGAGVVGGVWCVPPSWIGRTFSHLVWFGAEIGAEKSGVWREDAQQGPLSSISVR